MIAGAALPDTPAHAYVYGFSDFNGANVLTTSGGTASPVFSGWYDQTNTDTGFHSSTNQNYIVGQNESTPFDGSVFHDFWVFDISRLTGPVSSASFTVFSYTVATSYDGKASDTLFLYDVSTGIADLEASHNNRGDIWADLASGALWRPLR